MANELSERWKAIPVLSAAIAESRQDRIDIHNEIKTHENQQGTEMGVVKANAMVMERKFDTYEKVQTQRMDRMDQQLVNISDKLDYIILGN